MMRSALLLAAVFALDAHGTAARPAGPLPPVPASRAKAIQSFDYPDAAAARADWRSVYGSAPVSVQATGDHRSVLHFPCVFHGNSLERGCWERPVELDLNACQGVEFQIYCDDLSPISAFTLYFQSGQGWYGLNFNPEYAGRWCRVVLDKNKAVPEGTPAGWGKLRTIRFSAWRGYGTNTDVYLANLALSGADAPIVLVQPQTPTRTAQVVVDALRRYDLPYFMVNESELTSQLLEGRSVLWFLGDVGSSESTTACVKAFGGKVLSSRDLGEAVNLALDDAGQAAVIKRLGEASPTLWNLAAKRAIARVGRIAGYASAIEAVEAIRKTASAANRASVEMKIKEANVLGRNASELQSDGKPEQAIAAAEKARATMIEAYCLAQSPLADEHRAFWCHSALGVKGMPWDESIRILAENGFNAILPNMLWGGVAYYQSDVLPVWPELGTRGQPLLECLAACKKYGIQCHVWKVNWYMSGRSPREFLDRMKREGRTQVEFDGSGKDDWLCPSHPSNRQLEIDSMVELATRYDVDGIHFDYIRYPGPEACFCAGCRERFEQAIGKTVAHWPADTRQVPAIRQQWLEWRRSNITAVVAGVAERVRPVRPKVKISAAVFRIWPVDRDGVGQDWKLWCEKGYLDFVCPMDYTPNVPQFRDMVRHQQEWAGRVPCYPGIGLSVWPERNDICRLIDQITVTRELKAGGFTVFNYAEDEANVVLPMLGKGATRPK